MIRHAVLTTVAVGALSLAVLGQPVQAQDKPATQELADLRASAEAGEAQAQFNLGVRYTFGEGVPQDYGEAVAWYRRAAEQGHAVAQYGLGVLYGTGEGVPQDYVEAVAWYRRAAEQGEALAQYNLGVLYGTGEGVPPAWARLGRTYRRIGNWGDRARSAEHYANAEEALRRAPRPEPGPGARPSLLRIPRARSRPRPGGDAPTD